MTVTVKPERTEFPELVTKEREVREGLILVGTETLVDNEGEYDEPLKPEVAG